MKVHVVIAALLVLAAIPVEADFYKYVDTDGTVRFTDDLSRIPIGQRPDVKMYDDVTADQPEASQMSVATQGISRENIVQDQAVEGQNRSEIKHLLEQRKDELDREYGELSSQMGQLKVESHRVKTRDDLDAYNQTMRQLNAKIAAYEKKRKIFEADRDLFLNTSSSK